MAQEQKKKRSLTLLSPSVSGQSPPTAAATQYHGKLRHYRKIFLLAKAREMCV
jgi:hypothetical protein